MPRKKEFSFGGCAIGAFSPAREKITSRTKIVNVVLSFEEALKLGLAIDECVRELNSYNRSTKAGRDAALNLAIHIDKGRITVNESNLS